MIKQYNPSLRQEPRYQALPIIPLKMTESLLAWLKRTGRLKPRDIDLPQKDEVLEDIEYILEPEIYQKEKEASDSEE